MTATDTPVLALVRHGETEWNRARRIQGRTEVPLNDTGRAQARAAAAALAAHTWTSVHASPLGRAIETADIIGAALGLGSPAINAGLWERDFGEAEGLSVPDIEARWPGLSGIPGAEPLRDVAERSATAIASLYDTSPGGIVVAHGAMLRAGIQRLTGVDVPRILNGEIWLLRREATGYAATPLEAAAAKPLLQG
ncbi:histidine phosphatase family protein [Leucobacter aridicollis]|uniref:histidine phosphatase family protein n=1 Tax=Leucobacter aridicollis TaxID=283878 RepID=UPI002107ED8F|nr:histidine phosphatase family protein [Leucobacter aridicollis]UTX52543.1 histidine phosphatase family protein [Leucobacter aridicollis]